VPARVEEPPHPRRELGLRLLHVLPRCHGRSTRPIPFGRRGQHVSIWTSLSLSPAIASPSSKTSTEPGCSGGIGRH
jgi:hypothetical protein